MPFKKPEEEIRKEAWSVLTEVFRGIEFSTEAGSLEENLAAIGTDPMDLLGPARDHEIEASLLADVARQIVALHAKVLEALRHREKEFGP